MTAQCYYNWDKAPSDFEFTPADAIFSGDGGFWYDFGDWNYMFTDVAMTTKVTANGQAVAAVKDRGPNGFHIFQSDPAARPISATQGGFKCLDFDPAAPSFLMTSGNGMAMATCHGYIVFETDTNGNFLRLLSTSSSGSVNDQADGDSIAIHTSDTTAHFGVRARAQAIETKVGGTGNSPFGLYEYEISGAIAKSWYNGTLGTQDNSATGQAAFAPNKTLVGVMSANNAPSTTAPMDGRVWQILHLGTIPSASDQTKIKNWLNTYRY